MDLSTVQVGPALITEAFLIPWLNPMLGVLSMRKSAFLAPRPQTLLRCEVCGVIPKYPPETRNLESSSLTRSKFEGSTRVTIQWPVDPF